MKSCNFLQNKKIRFFLIFFYSFFCLLVSIFFYDFFEFGNIDQLNIQNIKNKIINVVSEKKIVLYILLFLLSFLWLLFLGFVSPILLIAGYMLNPYLSALVIALSNALAGSVLVFTLRYLNIRIKQIETNKSYSKIINFINQNVNFYFFIFRICAGFGVPSQIQNLLPLFTKIKILNYFFISLIGCLPIFYISCKIGNLMNKLSFDHAKNYGEFFTNIVIIAIILLFVFIIKKKFKKKFLNK